MKQTSKKTIAATLLLALLAACGPAPRSEPTQPTGQAQTTAAQPTATPEAPMHLKLGMFNFASFAPLYFAQAEGYYTEEGLEVELVSFAKSSEAIPALAAGEIDVVGFSLAASIFNAIQEGINLKYVADKGYLEPSNCTTDAWMASKQALDAGLSDPSTLAGRSISIPTGGTFEYSIDMLLAQGGLTQEDVNPQYIADNAARVEGLRNGAIDLVSLGEPWITRVVNSGAGEVWVPMAEVTPQLPVGLIVYGPTILDKNREAGIRFMAAYLRGVEQFNQGKTERNIELISEFTQLSPEDVQAACWNTFRADGGVDTESVMAFQEWALQKGLVNEALELDQIWTDEFLAEAAKRLGP